MRTELSRRQCVNWPLPEAINAFLRLTLPEESVIPEQAWAPGIGFLSASTTCRLKIKSWLPVTRRFTKFGMLTRIIRPKRIPSVMSEAVEDCFIGGLRPTDAAQ